MPLTADEATRIKAAIDRAEKAVGAVDARNFTIAIVAVAVAGIVMAACAVLVL